MCVVCKGVVHELGLEKAVVRQFSQGCLICNFNKDSLSVREVVYGHVIKYFARAATDQLGAIYPIAAHPVIFEDVIAD